MLKRNFPEISFLLITLSSLINAPTHFFFEKKHAQILPCIWISNIKTCYLLFNFAYRMPFTGHVNCISPSRLIKRSLAISRFVFVKIVPLRHYIYTLLNVNIVTGSQNKTCIFEYMQTIQALP